MQRGAVLLVEDDPAVSSVVREILEEAGHRVVSARNGVEAHALAERHDLALLVTDLLMPVAGGWELVQRLRRQGWKGLPVILFSAAADLEQEAARVGADAWISKPCGPEHLLRAVEAVLPGLPRGGGA